MDFRSVPSFSVLQALKFIFQRPDRRTILGLDADIVKVSRAEFFRTLTLDSYLIDIKERISVIDESDQASVVAVAGNPTVVTVPGSAWAYELCIKEQRLYAVNRKFTYSLSYTDIYGNVLTTVVKVDPKPQLIIPTVMGFLIDESQNREIASICNSTGLQFTIAANGIPDGSYLEVRNHTKRAINNLQVAIGERSVALPVDI